MSDRGQLSKSVQARFGLPDTFKTQSPFPFGGMNHQASRLAIGDQEAWWLENLIKIGDGNLRSVGDIGPGLFAVPTADSRIITNFFWFNIGLNNYCIVFMNDGSAIQVNPIGVQTVVSFPGSGKFYQGGSFPACVPWGNIYLLISNNNTQNDYWAWDGLILYGAGGISPQISLTSSGTTYTSPPTITIFGGIGSGISLTPIIKNGAVVSLKVNNPGNGYVPGDTVQAIFSGGGGDNGAILQSFLQATTVQTAVVLAGGSGYTTPPTVTFNGGGASAAATGTAVLTGDRVTSINITFGGTAYSSAPTIAFTGGGGSGAQAQAFLAPVSLQSVFIASGGTNYQGVPTLTFKGGFGSGAAATAILSGPGPLASIKVTNGGSGYTSLPAVNITDPTGTGAAAIVTGASGGSITAITLTDFGTGYTNPSVGFTGGGGTGAAATAAIGAGSISAVSLDNPGTGYITAPAIIVQSGLNNAAAATLDLMPFGVSGDSIETYQSEVWVQNPFQDPNGPPVGGVRQSSAPNSISDFATSDGGLEETVTDRFLRRHLTALRQSNGFLYPFGDSSVGVISNVTVSGNPPTKSLNNQNTDPQIGTSWRDSLQDFSRTILFANPFGINGLFGGAVTKISAKMNKVFDDALFPATINPPDPTPGGLPTPSAAVANFHSLKLYLLNFKMKEPDSDNFSNKMVVWNEQDWSVVSQSVQLTYIGTQEIDSNLVAWGTDGKVLYPLMQTPNNLTKKWFTKLYGAQQPYITKKDLVVYAQAENFADQNRAPALQIKIDTEYMSIPSSGSFGVAFPPGPVPANATPPPVQCPLLMARTGDIPGQQLGLQILSVEPDFAIYNLVFATEDDQAIFG